MAAVQKTEDEEEATTTDHECSNNVSFTNSSSIPNLLYDVETSHQTTPSIPTDMIVQAQLRDVIAMQKVAVETLVKNNISVLSASKESFDKTVGSQEERIHQLETSIQNDYVPREDYESLERKLRKEYVSAEHYNALKNELQAEYDNHAATQAELQNTLDKLSTLLQEMASLQVQKEKEKRLFDSEYERLQGEMTVAKRCHRDLEKRLDDQSSTIQTQETIIAEQQLKMEALNHLVKDLQLQLDLKTKKFQLKVMESDIEKQQEAYLNKMLNSEKKPKR